MDDTETKSSTEDMVDELATEIRGADLRLGDVIDVWWRPGRDTVITLRPYAGAYERDAGWQGVQTATFAVLTLGMTIFPGEEFTVRNR